MSIDEWKFHKNEDGVEYWYHPVTHEVSRHKPTDQAGELPSTYTMPEHGWTCFHCGETFKTPGAARDHFGTEPINTPACQYGGDKGILMALRRTQDLLREAQKKLAPRIEVQTTVPGADK